MRFLLSFLHQSGNFPFGESSVRGIVCRGIVRSGNGPSGNCRSGNCPDTEYAIPLENIVTYIISNFMYLTSLHRGQSMVKIDCNADRLFQQIDTQLGLDQGFLNGNKIEIPRLQNNN